LYTAQKSNSHYAPQPHTNQSVFKSLLNCTINQMCKCYVTVAVNEPDFPRHYRRRPLRTTV